MRIDPGRSIRRTLLILLLPASIALVVTAWMIHGTLLERMARSFVESRLQDEATFLQHQLEQSGSGNPGSLATGDYFEEVFHHAFAIRVGPETRISPPIWEASLGPLLADTDSGFIRQRGQVAPPAPADFLAYRKSFTLDGQPVVVIVAEDLTALDQAQRELHLWTAVVSVGLFVLLVLVIWLAINLALRSVSQLRLALGELQHGKRARIDVDAPDEFQPLISQLNQLLDTLDQRLNRSREALANLSHSVKTPIAAVRQLLEDSSRELDTGIRSQMAQRLSDIDRQLEAEMRRSQFAGPQAGKAASPVSQARDLLWMLGRLYPDKHFELETELSDEQRWPVEEHDLNEILGTLLDNAGKWSKTCVLLTLEQSPQQLCISVKDDGPGLSPELLPELGTRGLRLDQQTPGHGLGLAIAREIIERYNGHITFGASPRGGLAVLVTMPSGTGQGGL